MAVPTRLPRWLTKLSDLLNRFLTTRTEQED